MISNIRIQDSSGGNLLQQMLTESAGKPCHLSTDFGRAFFPRSLLFGVSELFLIGYSFFFNWVFSKNFYGLNKLRNI